MRPFDPLAAVLRLAAIATIVVAALWVWSLIALAQVNVCIFGRSWNFALVQGALYFEYPSLPADEISVSPHIEVVDSGWYSKKYVEGGRRILGFSVVQPGFGTYMIGVPLWLPVLGGVIVCVLLIRARRRRALRPRRDPFAPAPPT
jgi:hypothetical protein